MANKRKTWFLFIALAGLSAVFLCLGATPSSAMFFFQKNGGKEPYECPSACSLPACICPKTSPPGTLKEEEIPQFILLTWDDAVDEKAYKNIQRVLDYKNPNGCPLKATFFITTDYSDFLADPTPIRSGP